MLIVSKFHDFYDTALAHGVDKTIVFQRKFDETIIALNFPSLVTRKWSPNEPNEEDFWVGFCGKWYYANGSLSCFGKMPTAQDTSYGAEEINARIAKCKPKGRYDVARVRARHEELLKRNGEFSEALFLGYRTPTLAYRPDTKKLYINPCLKSLEFFKVFDPMAANQEIQMFISNNLSEQKDPPEISDKYRILAHGMDKTSFRRDKGGPTRKRKHDKN